MTEGDDISDTGVPTNGKSTPWWERRFPGRIEYELRALKDRGVTPEIDRDWLDTKGQFALRFDWSLRDGRTLRLHAIYPESFPYLRPQVYVEGGLEAPLRRHQNPIDGNLCLLGRDTVQWLPSLTLGQLLTEQIEHAVQGTGDEDPQGEPAEYWWNSLGEKDAYCLVDSQWDLRTATSGTLTIKYQVVKHREATFGNVQHTAPIIRALISHVYDNKGHLLHEWSAPIPSGLDAADTASGVPWQKFNETLFPSKDMGQDVDRLTSSHSSLNGAPRFNVGKGISIQLFGFAFPGEVAFETLGIGWAIPYRYGVNTAFKQRRKAKEIPTRIGVLPVYRAGEADLSHRSPRVKGLRNRSVLVVGIGAIGSPLAVELARNGCGRMHLLDPDVVEPGNSVRWELGSSAWGRLKTEALAEWMRREYTGTYVEPHIHAIGQKVDVSDVKVLEPLIEDVDVVVDASASHGVTTFVADLCATAGVPCISLAATPTVEGGFVVEFRAGGGCPICLERYWHDGTIEPPPGREDEDSLIQPVGCGERTFAGASYELEELALQAVRVVVRTLSGEPLDGPKIYTLSLNTGECHRPPLWSHSVIGIKAPPPDRHNDASR